jgi:hypothetical protein
MQQRYELQIVDTKPGKIIVMTSFGNRIDGTSALSPKTFKDELKKWEADCRLYNDDWNSVRHM